VKNLATYWYEHRLIVTVQGPEGTFCVTTETPFARVGAHESAEVVLPGVGEVPPGAEVGLGEVTLRYATGESATTLPVPQIVMATSVAPDEARRTPSRPPGPWLRDGQGSHPELSSPLEDVEVREAALLVRRETWGADRRTQEEALAAAFRQLAEEEARLGRDREVFQKELGACKERRENEEREPAAQARQELQRAKERLEAELRRTVAEISQQKRSFDQEHSHLVTRKADLQRERAELESAQRELESARDQFESERAEYRRQRDAWTADQQRQLEESSALKALLCQESSRLDAVRAELDRERAQLLEELAVKEAAMEKEASLVQALRVELEKQAAEFRSAREQVEAETRELESRERAMAVEQQEAAEEIQRKWERLRQQESELEVRRRSLDAKEADPFSDLPRLENHRADVEAGRLPGENEPAEPQRPPSGAQDSTGCWPRETEDHVSNRETKSIAGGFEARRVGRTGQSAPARCGGGSAHRIRSPIRDPAVERDTLQRRGGEDSLDREADISRSSEEMISRLFQLRRTRGRWWNHLMAAVGGWFTGNGPPGLPDGEDLGETDKTGETVESEDPSRSVPRSRSGPRG